MDRKHENDDAQKNAEILEKHLALLDLQDALLDIPRFKPPDDEEDES